MTPGLSAAQEAIRTSAPVRRAVIRAVAGAGKTRLLIERAQYLVGRGVPEARIWFLVFSTAAEEELKSRLKDKRLRCQVVTLHSFCRRQLSGVQEIVVLTQDDPRWRAVVAELKVAHTRFRNIERELERAWQVPAADLDSPRLRLREDAEHRIRALDSNGKRHLTFAQLLFEVQTMWAVDEHQLRAVQAQVDYLIVDELQDVSAQQLAIVEALAGARPLLAVGDPWQGIFPFQGAVPEVMRHLMDRAQVHLLETTFRSPAQHTLAAEALTGQRLVPAKGFDGSLAVYWTDSRSEAVDVLQASVRGLLDQEDEAEVAVLVETNREVAEVRALLDELHLTVRTSGREEYGKDEFCREVLWPAVAYLTGHRRPRGRHPLAKLGLGGANPDSGDLELIHAAWRSERHVSVVREVLSGERLRPFFDLWAALDGWAGPVEELPQLLKTLVPGSPKTDTAQHICHRAQDLSSLALKLGAVVPGEEAQVVVSTIHAAKGREWPRVVLYDAGWSSRRIPSEEQMAEATRLRYVALTRSTRDLVAVLHEDCHPAYRVACAPETLARIRRLESAFTGRFDGNDERLAADLEASPSIRAYLQDHAPEHLPRHRQVYLESLLGVESRVQAARHAPVKRVPLTGLPPEGR